MTAFDFEPIEIEDEEPLENSFSFQLFTLKNPKGQKLDHENISSIDATDFDLAKPTRMIIHGWQASGKFREELVEGIFEA